MQLLETRGMVSYQTFILVNAGRRLREVRLLAFRTEALGAFPGDRALPGAAELLARVHLKD